MDFIGVSTVNCGPLLGFFLSTHERCKVIHFNITGPPMVAWTVRQVLNTVPKRQDARASITRLDFDLGISLRKAGKRQEHSEVDLHEIPLAKPRSSDYRIRPPRMTTARSMKCDSFSNPRLARCRPTLIPPPRWPGTAAGRVAKPRQ
jgi:hypothetical protein